MDLKSEIKNIQDQKFGRLLVLKFIEIKNHCAFWLCRCDCEKEVKVRAPSLISGKTQSCGCILTEKITKYKPMIASAMKVWKYTYHQELPFEDFLRLSQLPCYWCGEPPSNIINVFVNKKKEGDFIYNGLDRKDNSVGHTIENLVPSCLSCNKIKFKMSYDEFIEYINRIHNFQLTLNSKLPPHSL